MGQRSSHSCTSESPSHVPPTAPAVEVPTLDSKSGESTILSAPALSQLCRAMSAHHTLHWTLLYSIDTHDRSFHRFLSECVRKGPTVVLIREKGSQKVFGGVNPIDWRSPLDRYDEAKGDVSLPTEISTRNRPANQHEAFYGTQHGCFVFAWELGTIDTITTWRPQPRLNSNYLYLVERAEDDKHVGFGMGGRVGHHGWFIDKWLERGYCHGEVCTTFGNPRLSVEESFEVDALEVWGLDPALCHLEGSAEDAMAVSALTGERLRFRRHQRKAEAGRDGKVLTGMNDGVESAKALLRMAGKSVHSDNL